MKVERGSALWDAIHYVHDYMSARVQIEGVSPELDEMCGLILEPENAGHEDGARVARRRRPVFRAVRNSARFPDRSFEMKIEDLARLEVGLVPLSVFHSHPGGLVGPSDGDIEHFPSWICKVGWVYTPQPVQHSGGAVWPPGHGALVRYDQDGPQAKLQGTLF